MLNRYTTGPLDAQQYTKWFSLRQAWKENILLVWYRIKEGVCHEMLQPP